MGIEFNLGNVFIEENGACKPLAIASMVTTTVPDEPEPETRICVRPQTFSGTLKMTTHQRRLFWREIMNWPLRSHMRMRMRWRAKRLQRHLYLRYGGRDMVVDLDKAGRMILYPKK